MLKLKVNIYLPPHPPNALKIAPILIFIILIIRLLQILCIWLSSLYIL